MIAAQYKITLPSDYDMTIIKDRVKINGHKTDGFDDLRFKLYLVTEKGKHNNSQNSYCPFYLWKSNSGLNKFLFNGFYDNILHSFGWQRVHIGIPLSDTTSSKMRESKYVLHKTRDIQPQESLLHVRDQIEESIPAMESTEHIVIYNPDTWKLDVFYFSNNLSVFKNERGVIYDILYISQGELDD